MDTDGERPNRWAMTQSARYRLAISKAAALIYAERMRAIIERYPFEHGPLTASFGVAGYPDDPGNVADLIKRADHALYEAKRQGRNLVGGS